MLIMVDTEFIGLSFYNESSINDKTENVGVTVILRLEKNVGKLWEKEEDIKPLKKEPCEMVVEGPNGNRMQREKTGALLKSNLMRTSKHGLSYSMAALDFS